MLLGSIREYEDEVEDHNILGNLIPEATDMPFPRPQRATNSPTDPSLSSLRATPTGHESLMSAKDKKEPRISRALNHIFR